MKAFIPLYLANVREFVRDRSALFWTVAFPLVFILVFGMVFSGSDDITFSVGLVNEDGPASEELVEGFKAIDAFDVSTGSRDDEINALESGDRSAVIVIPQGTGAALGQALADIRTREGATAQLEVFYDPADQNTSQIVLNIVNQIVSAMNDQMTGVAPVITVEARQVTTETDLRVIDYMLPGLLALSLLQLGLMGTAAPLVSLREKGVLRRMGASPLSRSTVLASQLAFRLTLALLTTVLLVGVGVAAFGIELKLSTLPATIGAVLLGAAAFVSLGYLLSALAKSEEAVEGLVSLPYFLFMFLSGTFWPIEIMPSWIRPVVDAIPLTYLGDLLRKTMIGAGSYFSAERSVLILAVWLMVSAVLAIRLFRWEPQA